MPPGNIQGETGNIQGHAEHLKSADGIEQIDSKHPVITCTALGLQRRIDYQSLCNRLPVSPLLIV